MAISKDLGPVSGYAVAVEHGFTGTEEEWIQLVLKGTENAQTADTKAAEALASATDAAGSAEASAAAASDAGNSASAADGSAEAAGKGAEEAQGYAENAAASAAEAARQAALVNADELNRRILAAYPTDTASGSIASFSDGADAVPVKKLVVNIEPVQEGEGDPSPKNVRPIHGWAGAIVTGTGKNIFGGNLLRDGILASMPSAVDNPDERYVSFASIAQVKFDITRASGLLGKFKPNTQYTFIFSVYKTSGKGTNLRVYYTDGTHSDIPYVSAEEQKDTSILVTKAGKTVKALSKVNLSGNSRIYYDESGIFEGVLTADDFEAYQGETISLTWESEAGTVYGGTLTVNEDGSGELVSTMRKIGPEEMTFARFSDAYSDTANNIYGPVLNIENVFMDSDVKNVTAFSNAAISRSGYIGKNFVISGSIYLSIYSPSPLTNAAEVRSYLSSIGFYVVGTLRTPVTYHLTAEQVGGILSTLHGQNNIWADCGDIAALEYRADTKLYIDKKIAELQALVLENNG